ncbi:g12581 [Coccomyxa viridis]|uniref:HVA22-like protein n=1 Tax=Coccomyxa viridis TaxID=1274662 RepID=A0ABP1GFC2_9CHLO
MFSFGIFKALALFLGFAYPTYASYKALLTPGTADDHQWLTYWVVYGFLETAESIIEQFLWIPFYYEFKCIFLLWLVLPQTKGAAYLFQHFICPFMKNYASHIDPIFGKADQIMQSNQMNTFVNMSQQYGPNIAQQAMATAQQEAKRLAQSQGSAQGRPGAGYGQRHSNF